MSTTPHPDLLQAGVSPGSVPHPDLLQAGVSPGSVQTLASRLWPPPTSNPLTSKRVCFYKSGDPQFGGLRMVINGRTFKTFDALLDGLSKKVPLPFGVRTITTPRGTNSIRALEELQDGGSYVCTDQKRVKPLNLEKANQRQVPWNTTRPISAKRRGNMRQIPRRTDFGIRAERMINRTVAVRTPKRLVVYKNKDPTVKRIVVLQRRTAPSFDALLDYLSQVMQFPVVKLFSADGRRVEGLAGLILCSGVVVAAGNEPFKLSSFNFQGGPPPTQSGLPTERTRTPPQIYKHKSPSSSTGSRKFSLSSERYFVSQIKKSLSESLSEHESHHSGSLETELNPPSESVDMEPCDNLAGVAGRHCPTMPTEDDIEKSFRVNQDGSMTVEMKVRLTLKQEEMIHWTTTLSRSSVTGQHMEVCASQPMSGPNSPYVNDDSSKNAGGRSAERAPERRHHRTSAERTVAFKERGGGNCSSTMAETSRRTPTPGPTHVKSKSASVESATTVTETEVQESTVGTYSYMERTSEGEVTEGYCVVSRSSSSNIRPVPKPRKTGSAEGKKSTLHSSLKASGVAEVLQIENSGLEVTETVMHIYESQPQGSYDNYLASPQHVSQNTPSRINSPRTHSKIGSTDSGPCSSNNDCDVDFTRISTASESLNGKKDEMFSLSSESTSPQRKSSSKLATGSSGNTAHESSSANENTRNKSPGRKKKRTVMSRTKQNASLLSSGSDKGQRTILTESSKTIKIMNSSDNQEKTGSSAESALSKKMGRVKKSDEDNGRKVSASKTSISALSAEHELNSDESAVRDLSHNLNNPESEKPKKIHRKNVQNVLASLSPGRTKNTILKQKSMSDEGLKLPKENRELSESISMPLLCSPPSVEQYVETWLQQISDSAPYMEELNLTETEEAMLQVGNDLSKGSEEKSTSEILSEEEENLPEEDTSVERLVQQQPIQVRCEGELIDDEPQERRGFCRSMPSVRINPADQDWQTRMHKSTEVLFPLDSQPSQDIETNSKGGMRPVLEQLCLSLRSIRRVVIPTHTETLERAQSLPDFSDQVASVFGASSTKLLSFLSVMTLKDGSSSQGSQLSLMGGRSSSPEALKVMQSLEKLTNTEDEKELKASLSDLRNSTSPTFQENWRDFQEKYDIDDNPLPSPKTSEQEFILDVYSEAGDQSKDHPFGIEQLMEELSMSEELRQELSSLAEGEMMYHDATDLLKGGTEEASSPETADASTIIRANVIEDSEVVEIMSIANMKEGDNVNYQGKEHPLEEENKGSHPGEECSLAGDYDSTEIQETTREISYCETTEVKSEHSKESIKSPRGSPAEEGSQLKEDESVTTQAASPSANSPDLKTSDVANDDSVCSVPNSEQERVATTHEDGSPTNDPHSSSADEECNSGGELPSHDTEREERLSLADREDRNCAEGLPSRSEEGDGEVVPHDTDSSCHQSLVSESKIKESVQEESEFCNCQDLDLESGAQTKEAASSCGVISEKISSAESAKSQKTNKSKTERKGNRSKKSSIKSSTSSNTGIRKVSSSIEALHLGVATSRNSSPKVKTTDSQGSMPQVRKPLTPMTPGGIKKVTTKSKSVSGDRLKSPEQNLNESASTPFLCAPPSNIHQYVGSWLENTHPESDPYMEEITHLDPPETRAVFQIGTSSSEGSEEMRALGNVYPEEEDLSVEENADERQRPAPLIRIKCDRELVEDRTQRMRNFCRSMPTVRIQPADQDWHTKTHKSTEALFPLDSRPSQDIDSNSKGGMKPILHQLCLSLKSIRQAVSPTRPVPLEKTRSLPDFSDQVASVFGASSTKLLSFLSVMTLKDGSSGQGSQLSIMGGRSSSPEALKVMQSLEKLTNTEDEKELKASLSDLRNSTSPTFQESWRDFQEKYDIDDNPLPSPKTSEQEFLLDVYSEAGDQSKYHPFGIEQLMEELSMSEELRQELSSLAEGEMMYHDATDLLKGGTEEASSPETADASTIIRANVIEDSEVVEIMSIANMKEGDNVNYQGKEHPLEEENKGSHPGEECSLAGDYDSTEIQKTTREISYCETTEVKSEHSEENIKSPRGSPAEEGSQLKEDESVTTQAASPSANSPDLKTSDVANDDSVCSVPNSEQEGVATTHEDGSPTNDPHSSSADEECNSGGELPSHDTEREERLSLADREDRNCAEGLPSRSEEGDGEVVPHDTDSSCHQSLVSESKIKESVQEESEFCNCQDLDLESGAQTKEAASSCGVISEKISSAESAKSQKTNKSKTERKGNRSKKSSIKSSTSSNTGIRKVLSSIEALHLGVATSRNSSPKVKTTDSQGSMPQVRKPLTPITPGGIKKVTTKSKSVNGDRLKSPEQNLIESASMPFLCAPPSDVHQYVGSWLENTHPESDPYMEEITHLDPPATRAVFQIGTSSSEGSEEMRALGNVYPEEEDLSVEEDADERQRPAPPILIKCDRELVEDRTQRMRSFCRSMPTVRIQPADQEWHTKTHKSTEALFPLDSRPSQDIDSNSKGGMKPILHQLCLSLKSIRQAVSPTRPVPLEKTRSLTDFSGQVASVFGASSTKLLSFLSVMTLKDGSSGQGSQLSIMGGRSSSPEALKVMQSLEKLTNTEDEKELKASLSDLRNSTSPTFQESWRDFQEKYDIDDDPLPSPKNLEQEYGLDVHSEAGDQNKDHPFGIEQLMEELSMSEELRQEIASLVEEEITYHDAAELPTRTTEEASRLETTDTSTIIRADDVEDSEEVEMMPEAYTEDEEKANAMDEDNLQELNNIQGGKETINSIEEEISLAGSNEAGSIKCEETGSRTAESEDMDSERFLTPVTESEPKDMDRDSESWKSHDTDHQLESWKGHDTDHQSESWKGHDTDHQSDSGKGHDTDHQSESCKDHDTDHQSEEAKCESIHEDVATEEEGNHVDSHAGEEGGYAQQSDDLGKAEDVHGNGLAEEEICHEEQADILAHVVAFVEGQKDSLKGSGSCEGQDTHSENSIHPDEMEDEQPDTQGYRSLHQPVELSQELLDFVNNALLSSSLTFTYDSNGNLKIQPIDEANSVREIFPGKTIIESQYGLKRLPSPNTSDVTDYRPDTADSGERRSQVSFNISTDVGEEEADRVSTSQSHVDQKSEMSYGKNSAITENGSVTSPYGKKSNFSPKSDFKSMCSLYSNQDTISRASPQDSAHLNTSGSFNGDSESVQCLSFYSQADLREGVLIDKGRWLLKENHLIRKSPPLSMGMYGQMDTSSADSGQDIISEYASSSQYLNHQPSLAVISSSELEEMAKPPTPKCTYFTIPHSSDSDPFRDDQSSNGNRQGDIMRGNRVSPQEEPSKTWARKHSSFSSFASVEFKLPDGKIHPEGGGAVERPARSRSIGGRTLREEDSTESLQLRCGQNCPIL
ncbi:oxygen-regulated protein 1 isoform X2 [Clupea harengus]|nr:oxygen-regulated protein 1 isoform X2 [Clupea harengus]